MKKTLSLAMAFLLTFGSIGLTGCGGVKEAPNTETDLEIFSWIAGNGSEWLDKTIDAFQKKFPEVNVVKKYSSSNDTWANELTSPSTNTIDLYISSMTNFLAYTEYLEPLDDVLNATWEGESVPLINKSYKPMLDTQRGEDGKLYAAMFGGGVSGLVYNKTVFEEKGYEIPRTTDELVLLAADMVDDKYTPFIHCNNADYWTYCVMPWWGQYSGVEDVYNFWNAKYVDPETGAVEQPSLKAMKTEGKKKALDALYSVISPKGYTYSASNQATHTEAQTYFLSGKALMMPNGSWLENEMKNTSSNIEYSFMKLPVISSLGEKLGITDKILAEVVSYVDSADYAAGTINDASTEYDAARVKTCSNEVIAAVAEARKVVYSEAVSNRMIIPNYANAKDWAKKFVQFMNSDEALNIYSDTLNLKTFVTPTKDTVDKTDWSPFMQSAASLMDNASYVFRAKGYKLFYNTNMVEFLPYVASTYFTASNAEDRKNSDEFWDYCVEYYDNNWNNLLKQAGLS